MKPMELNEQYEVTAKFLVGNGSDPNRPNSMSILSMILSSASSRDFNLQSLEIKKVATLLPEEKK